MLSEVRGSNAYCSCRLHRWYCGARVRFSAAVIPGGKKFGTVAWICASVCPDAKALMNAELEAAAFENKLPVSSGVRPSPVTVNEFTSGGLLKKFDAMLSTESWKTPIPPSRTVLCVTPKGCQAKLNRGDHRILSRAIAGARGRMLSRLPVGIGILCSPNLRARSCLQRLNSPQELHCRD